jgi:hypothetical protein
MRLELAGKRFGRLTVIRRLPSKPGARNAFWQCRCDCGNLTTGAAGNLGKTKFSCGCLSSENGTIQLRINRLAKPNLHGMSQSSEWQIWSKLKSRCKNPNGPKFHRYGGRGIKVCDRWLNSFEDFLSDMGPRPSKLHSIDRINNDGNYEPSNCRWATNLVQGRNSSRVRLVTIKGKKLCIAAWCETLGVPLWKPYEMLRNRGAKRNLPPRFKTIDNALRHLHKAAAI